ncbi:uncharacterized protein YukE [Saccharopolyspora lacisalsi]|uniref:Uncharacterized protein YukE n=1 Tax=Halosaccharopolyspora lacisalsi TaxID=1000566 RepID=A0A839DLD6_9PSEU|nr:hypothetical protein [Halosaccharopolyspora lacisalsi]MBA8822762.1 uncharacterized protein YukE [Halosaccharopolyspora lacisalsi]
MAELGETTDPKALVPGDPDGLNDKATKLREEGERFETVGAGLKRVEVGDWKGEASEAFWSTFSPEPPKWIKVCDATESVSKVLSGYAETLRWAQNQASEAIALWERGEDESRRAAGTQAASAKGDAPGSGYRQQAQQTLAHAREQLDAAGTRAAAAIGGGSGKEGALDGLVHAVTSGWKAEGKADASGPNAGASASWPKGGKMGELKAFAELAKASAQGSVGNEYAQLSGKASATVAAEASLSGGVTNEGVAAKAEVAAGAKATAQGKAELGPYLGYNAKGEAFVGGKASASASVGLDGLHANAGAFAGGKVTGKAGGDIGGIGINATAEGWAGPGAEAGVHFGPDESGTWHIGANAGVSPIVGGKLGFELTVDPEDVAATASDAAQFVGDAGESVGEFASSSYDTVTGWVS